jgi:hypothetical protein
VVLRSWIEEHAPEGVGVDAEAVTMVIGAAMMGLASCRPMLASGAGVAEQDDDEVLRRCLDVLMGVAAVAVGAGPEALGPAGAKPDEEDA